MGLLGYLIALCGIAWCGIVCAHSGQYWENMVCYGMSREGMVWYSVIQYSMEGVVLYTILV